MYKKLYLNPDYHFDINGNVKFRDEFIENVGFTEIVVDNKKYNFCNKWLGLLAHYEVSLPLKDILKIEFVECKFKVIGLKCGMLMVFKNPILREKGSRVIPGFTGFVINEIGTVISTYKGRVLKPSIGPYGYPYVNVYDADKSRWRSVCLHILLARAFKPNDHKTNNAFFVNHIDGNKLNFALSNLEWTTSLKNNNHAVDTGLRKDNMPCLVRNIYTGEVSEHPSVKRALVHIGAGVEWSPIKRCHGDTLIPKVFLNKYEIKLIEDKSEWFYSELNSPEKYDLVKRVFEVMNISTGEVFESSTLRGLQNLTGVSEAKVNNSILSFGGVAFSGFSFRGKSSKAWPLEFKESKFFKPRSFVAENKLTSEVKKFSSLNEAIRFFNVDKRTFKNRLINKKPINNWKIDEAK